MIPIGPRITRAGRVIFHFETARKPASRASVVIRLRAVEVIVTQSRSWKPDDIIRAPAHSGGFRVWRVVGVYLGATAQESVIEIETLDRLANTQGRMYVPCELLEAAMGGAFAR